MKPADLPPWQLQIQAGLYILRHNLYDRKSNIHCYPSSIIWEFWAQPQHSIAEIMLQCKLLCAALEEIEQADASAVCDLLPLLFLTSSQPVPPLPPLLLKHPPPRCAIYYFCHFIQNETFRETMLDINNNNT